MRKFLFIGLLFACFLVLTISSDEAEAFSGSGSGTEGDPYVITDVYELQEMNTSVSSNFTLGNDIDASVTSTWNGGAGFLSVGNFSSPFVGSFDGDDYTISGLYINRASNYHGLFGYVFGANISDVGMVDVDISGTSYLGGLVGRMSYSFVNNSFATGDVSGGFGGGLVGHMSYSFVNNSFATGDVSGTSSLGGLVGLATTGFVSNSFATGNVSGIANLGGLVGYNDGGNDVTNSYAIGDVSGTGDRLGGLVGFFNSGDIDMSYATGNVSGGNNFVGGLVGFSNNGIVNNSFATGGVSGSSYVGGLVGRPNNVSNSYSVGGVSGTGSYVGGLLGRMSFSLVSSFYDITTSGQFDNDGRGVPKFTSEMKTESTFTSWDFVSTWSIIEGVTYPQFYGSLPIANISSPEDSYVTTYNTIYVWSNGSIGEYYNWSWGDGSYTNSISPVGSHSYILKGVFVLNLSVSNSSFGVFVHTDSITITVGARVNNVDTGGWYLSIQEGVDDSMDGETLYVYDDGFVERVSVDKEISIIGVNSPLIDGFGGVAFLVDADDVVISGFTITNSSVGVSVMLSTGVLLVGNMIEGNVVGVGVELSSNVGIRNNTLSLNDVGVSMLSTSQDNYVYYNRFENNTLQSVDNGTNNTWDDGVSEGNFWSDYLGEDIDADGIGDTELPHHGDRYPITDRRHSPTDQLYYDAQKIMYLVIVFMLINTVVGLFTFKKSSTNYFRRKMK